jgi:hypothetical protein
MAKESNVTGIVKGFQIDITTHTPDAEQVLEHPEKLRFMVGTVLDEHGLQEEVDYTLQVARTYDGRVTLDEEEVKTQAPVKAKRYYGVAGKEKAKTKKAK